MTIERTVDWWGFFSTTGKASKGSGDHLTGEIKDKHGHKELTDLVIKVNSPDEVDVNEERITPRVYVVRQGMTITCEPLSFHITLRKEQIKGPTVTGKSKFLCRRITYGWKPDEQNSPEKP